MDADVVQQAAHDLEIAYQTLLNTLDLTSIRPGNKYAFLVEDKFNFSVVPSIISSYGAADRERKVTSPFLMQRPEKSSEASVLAYSFFTHLVFDLTQEAVGENLSPKWGQIASGIQQWLLENSLPTPPWRWAEDRQSQQQAFLDKYRPLRMEQLALLTDGNAGFAAGDLLMSYLTDEYEPETMTAFLRGLGQYESWQELIPAVFAMTVSDFESKWNAWLERQVIH